MGVLHGQWEVLENVCSITGGGSYPRGKSIGNSLRKNLLHFNIIHTYSVPIPTKKRPHPGVWHFFVLPLMESFDEISTVSGGVVSLWEWARSKYGLCNSGAGFLQAIPNLFGITTSTHCGSALCSFRPRVFELVA